MKVSKNKQSPEAIVLGLVSGLIAIYLLIRWKWSVEVIELIYAATFIGLMSILFHQAAVLISKGWMFFGLVLGKLIGSILLSVVYYLILTPISVLQKIFSAKDKLNISGKRNTQTGWRKRAHIFTQTDLEELW